MQIIQEMIIAFIIALTRYDDPGTRPEVLFIEVNPDIAFYGIGAGIIRMPRDCIGLQEPLCQGLFAHEFTHYLQDLNGKYKGWKHQCPVIAKNEVEAYRVQANFLLKQFKIGMPVLNLPTLYKIYCS